MPENKKTISAPELLDMNYGKIKPVVGEIIKEGLPYLGKRLQIKYQKKMLQDM